MAEIRRMTIQIGEDLAKQIDVLADRCGQPKTALVSMAIMYGVQQIEDGVKNPVARASEKNVEVLTDVQNLVSAMGAVLGLKKDKRGNWYQQQELKIDTKAVFGS